MNDNEFDSLCKANSFGAVARGELPLIPRGMLKVLVDAAYAAGQKAEREAIFIEWENAELLAAEVERLRGILQDVLDNDRFAALENANNLDDELKAQIIEAIGNKKEGE